MAKALPVSVEGESQSSREDVKMSPTASVLGVAEGEKWSVAGGGKFNHPIYKKLSYLSGEVNALPLKKVKEKLTALNLSSVYVSTRSVCSWYSDSACIKRAFSCMRRV